MSRFTSLLRKLAHPRDRELLDNSPSRTTRLRVLGRIGLRFWWAYLLILFVLSIGTVSAGMDVYHRTEQPAFCGGCHEMSANFGSWSESRHKNITCADCHSRPGLMGWVQAKTAGVKQLKVHFSSESLEGIKVEANQRGIIDGNCRRCHEGVARVGERLGLGVSHRQHLQSGMDCVTCHTASFTHPQKRAVADAGIGEEELEKAAREARFVDVAQCFKCHDGVTALGASTVFSARDELSCLKCHPDADQALAHGARHPTAARRKPCLDCHDATPGEVHFAIAKGPAMCEKCHEKQQHQSRHSPYKKGECDQCHRVMSPAYLFKSGPRPTNAVCLGCHEELSKLLASGSTAKPGPFSDGDTDLHRAHLAKLQEVRDDWCLDCHAPHGSDAEWGMLRIRPQADFKKPGTLELSDVGGQCAGGCHLDKPVIWSGH